MESLMKSFSGNYHHLLSHIAAGKEPYQSSWSALKAFHYIFHISYLPFFYGRQNHFKKLSVKVVVTRNPETLHANLFNVRYIKL